MEPTISMAELLEMQSAGLGTHTFVPFGPYQGYHICTVPVPYLRQIRDDLILNDHPELRQAIVHWLQMVDEHSSGESEAEAR